MKNSIRNILNGLGFEIFRYKRMPYGLNIFLDVSRNLEIEPSVIFDVGANVGDLSLEFRKVFSNSRIFAFEPVKSTFNRLNENVSNADINTYQLGMGDSIEKKKIYLQNESSKNSLIESLSEVNSSSNFEEVTITTVDNFCSSENIDTIDILKIDTEGFGLKVLEGSRDLLSRGKVKSVFIEVGFDRNDLRHDFFCDVEIMLSRFGFNTFGFYDQWIEKSRLEFSNALFVLEEK
jgi:FkbM family methyltransferase